MKRIILTVCCTVMISFVPACQSDIHREYYEPNDSTLTEIDGRKYGAVKQQTIKNGVRDYSNGKTLKISGAGL